jgi:60 kDa SS-A/Ro ribonucleoprotein
MTTDPLTRVRTRTSRTARTPQTVRDNPRQVQNNAGGYVYGVDDLTRLNRFLIMGSEGSYYASARTMTLDNAEVLTRMVDADPLRVVQEIVEISTQGRAAKQDPAIFALAVVAGLANDEGKAAAFEALPQVARTASTFFTFSKYLTQFRSWSGRAAKRAGRAWYTERPADRLAYQMLKYRARQGYSQRDMIRILHPVPPTPQHDALFKWAAKDEVTENLPSQFRAFLDLQAHGEKDAVAAAQLIREHSLPWEAVPDELMNSVPVWEALLDANIGMTALIRHLSRLTNLGMLGKGKDTRVSQVVEQLTDAEAIRRARIHPINVLVALKTYAQGHSVDGKGKWTPERKIIDALDEAFYTSFKTVEPTGKRILLAVDCSSSMGIGIFKSPLNAREAAAAMVLSIAKVEKDFDVVGFTMSRKRGQSWSSRLDMDTNGLTELDLSPRQRLDDAVRTISREDFGGTDCALPFTWALAKKAYYDTVVILTDNESWAGPVKVEQALRDYRAQINAQARLVAVAFTATEYSVGDPNDALTLNIAGLDSAVPTLVQNFMKAEF